MNKKPMTRREFLKKGSLGALFLLGGGLNSLGSSASLLNTFLKQPAGLRPATLLPQMGDMFMPDAEVLITASEKFVQILPGAQTRVWGYEGELISGSGVTVQSIPGSYLGPILRVRKGTKLRLIFQNDLAEDSVIHPHGLRVPEDCDGQPMQAIGPGETKVYEFQVIDRAGAAWFHPHPMARTAEQVVMGLAGLFNVWGPEEEMAVPGASTGANDVPVIIQ